MQCVIVKKLAINWRRAWSDMLKRNISALYITGDKANENYVTLQPFMDFKGTLSDTQLLEESIKARGWKTDLNAILQKYTNYQKLEVQIQQVEAERAAITKKLKELTKSTYATNAECNALKERGKNLRYTSKSLKEQSYPIEDEFVHDYLNLPNILHVDCPRAGSEKILYRSAIAQCKQKATTHLNNKELVRFMDNSGYYLLDAAAEFDLLSMQSLTNYFVESGGFVRIANPDFVRRVLLEANATPMEHYHLVLEEHLQNKINPAYLTGGASFEGFLGAFTKLCIYPSVLPIRLVSCGRNYERVIESSKTANLFTATQSNAVQTFVATQSAHEAQQQMEEILNLAVNFYKELGICFRITYADASELTAAESLRAVIEVYSPAEECYVCVGRVSNYADFVSKRILFSMRQQKAYLFPHIIGGPILYTTGLIAALIEHGLKLEDCHLLGTFDATDDTIPARAIEEFKNIFK